MLVHSTGELDKYRFSQEITVDNINAYVADYLSGTLQKYLKSAPAPATNDEAVKIIVGSTF